MSKIKVDGKNSNRDAGFNHCLSDDNDLFVYGHRLESILDYFGQYHDLKLCTKEPMIVGVVGTYEKARGMGRTKEFDALDLKDVGWVDAALGKLNPPESLEDLVADQVQTNLLYTKRYFVVLTSYAKHLPPKDMKFVSGQKSGKVFLEAGNQVSFQEIHDWLFFHTANTVDWEHLKQPCSGFRPAPPARGGPV